MIEKALFLVLLQSIHCFNISPHPNIIIRKPASPAVQRDQTRSSYFGYSINLRKNHILISAPRSQPMLKEQKDIWEPGTVYKCTLNNNSKCYPYHFDLEGNAKRAHLFNSNLKDNQTLGFAMDGNENEDNRFVVCAPALKNLRAETGDQYFLHGICYAVNSTKKSQLMENDCDKLEPLLKTDTRNQIIKEKVMVNYTEPEVKNFAYGECGFSVHITEDNEEIIMGCPNVHNSHGTVVRYRKSHFTNDTFQEYDILLPANNIFTRNHYFGYAVSSGKFLGPKNDTIYYVASAPHSNYNFGQVHVFEFAEKRKTGDSGYIVKECLRESNIGVYFGYSLVCEDFNNDGFSDIAVSAPLYSKDGLYENGAVYIFSNNRIVNKLFSRPKILTSEFSGNGRFGTTLAKIGDINLDGYNDLAVSAPFEGNGVVYIFLGSASGLSSKPSQRIEAPSELPNAFGESKSYFGHGMSRGVDIDGNEYKDIAIGSPNAELVYVFKTYPVVKVTASVKPSKNLLFLNDTTLSFMVCGRFQSKVKINVSKININYTLAVDKRCKRASFSSDELENIKHGKMTLERVEKCKNYSVNVRGTLKDIVTPIFIQLNYELAEKISLYGQTFCETCVVTDPRDSKIISSRIIFETGCKGRKCLTDLAVVGTLINVRQPYVLGSAKTIEIKYDISNSGEAAYLSQMKIIIPTNVTQFSRIPSICNQEIPAELICRVKEGRPLEKSETVNFTISLDATRLEGSALFVTAEVSSDGSEQNPADNVYSNEIVLSEFSNVEIIGQSSMTQLSYKEQTKTDSIQYSYKIYNHGPSEFRELTVGLQVPLKFVLTSSAHDHKLVDTQGSYKEKYFNGTFHKMNNFANKMLASDEQFMTDLPRNRTVFHNCSWGFEELNECTEIRILFKNFVAGDEPIILRINFTLDLAEIDKELSDAKDISVFMLNAQVQRTGDDQLETVKIVKKNPFTVLYNEIPPKAPVWLYILSFTSGLLLLVLVWYVLYRLGFFRRKQKEELQRVIRESKRLTLRELEFLNQITE